MSTDPAALIDTQCYPIGDPFLVDAQLFRARYERTGLLILNDSLRRSALTVMRREARELEQHAHFVESAHNVYLAEHLQGVHGKDPAARLQQTTVGSVPYDRLPSGGSLRQLYQWGPLKEFIRTVLGKPELHRFEDPLGACSINVFRDVGRHGWHFDESEFSVTLMLQAPDDGGEFEYVPGIRRREDEAEILTRVLDRDRRDVVRLPFTEGTLLIFSGRQTLHRVTPVSGDRSRLVPVLCFSAQPGMRNSEAVRAYFWGRAG